MCSGKEKLHKQNVLNLIYKQAIRITEKRHLIWNEMFYRNLLIYQRNGDNLIDIDLDIVLVFFSWGLSHSGIFSLIWRRHQYRWRATNFDLYSALMAIEQWGLACHTYCDMGHPFIMVISEDPWHSHLLPSVWQWSCHYLVFFRLKFVAAGIPTPNHPHARLTL